MDIFGSLITILGVFLLLKGLGYRKRSYTSWKLAMILFTLLALYSFPPAILDFYLPLSFIYLDRSSWLIVLIISTGLLIYTFKVRSLLIVEIKDETFKDKEKLRTADHLDKDKDSGKCPACGRMNESNTQICPFCGFNFRRNE